MPHLFTNRQRHYHIIHKSTPKQKNLKWESANALIYLFGGIFFIIGSIFSLPSCKEFGDAGSWIFMGGSFIYLIVTGHDLLEAVIYLLSRNKKTIWNWIEVIAAVVYVLGTILFTIGSIFFLSEVNLIMPGAVCFIIGSFLFLIGSCINVMQIVQAGSINTLQLMNATAISFALGSMLFIVASIPYAWSEINIHDHNIILSYIAWEYIIGSLLFFIGGVFNCFRSYQATHYYRSMESKDKK